MIIKINPSSCMFVQILSILGYAPASIFVFFCCIFHIWTHGSICGLGNHSALRLSPDAWRKIYSTGSPGAPSPGATAAGTSAPQTFTLHSEGGWGQSNGTFCGLSSREYIILKYSHHQIHNLSFQRSLSRNA